MNFIPSLSIKLRFMLTGLDNFNVGCPGLTQHFFSPMLVMISKHNISLLIMIIGAMMVMYDSTSEIFLVFCFDRLDLLLLVIMVNVE